MRHGKINHKRLQKMGIISQSKIWFSCYYCLQLMFSVEKCRVYVAHYNTLDTFEQQKSKSCYKCGTASDRESTAVMTHKKK